MVKLFRSENRPLCLSEKRQSLLRRTPLPVSARVWSRRRGQAADGSERRRGASGALDSDRGRQQCVPAICVVRVARGPFCSYRRAEHQGRNGPTGVCAPPRAPTQNTPQKTDSRFYPGKDFAAFCFALLWPFLALLALLATGQKVQLHTCTVNQLLSKNNHTYRLFAHADKCEQMKTFSFGGSDVRASEQLAGA